VISDSVPELLAALDGGALTSVELTERSLARIAEVDGDVGAVLALHPDALEAATNSDARRASGHAGVLDGLPVLVKDNIAVAGLPTTAGSRALTDHRPPDAPLVTRLRAAGAVVLGKTNLSEWANFRSTKSTSGWSAVGGQTRNPHALDRNPSGSSSGSAAAAAAALAPLTIGTETDGSIVSPAGVCGVVGLKPTLGTLPGTGIVPISAAQDTAGPITPDVAGAALLFAILAGQPRVELHPDALAGVRIGVWAPADDAVNQETAAVLAAARTALTGVGAVVTDVVLDTAGIEEVEWPALLAEFRHQINAYLAGAPGAAVHNLTDLIAFNAADDVELSRFGQENLELALRAPDLDDPDYRMQRQRAVTLARTGLDGALAGIDALASLTNAPAWPIDYERGDGEPFSTSTPAAVAGYPSITVPAGHVQGLPVGVSLTARPGQDRRLLSLAYAFEQVTGSGARLT
jgi:amidase